MQIRKATEGDINIIKKLNKDLFDFEEIYGHEYNLNWTYEEAGEKYFKQRFEDGNSIIFAAEDGGAIIGYVIAFVSNYTYRRVNPICEIENMFVEEKYRRKGVGKLLIEAVKGEAGKRGVKRLRVGAIIQNERAVNFYRGQGFSDMNIYLEREM